MSQMSSGVPQWDMPLSQYMLTLLMWASYLPCSPLFHSQLELEPLCQSLLLERKLRRRCCETQPGKKLHDVLSMKFCLWGLTHKVPTFTLTEDTGQLLPVPEAPRKRHSRA